MNLKVHYYCWRLPKVSKQTLKIMKLIAVILFAACVQVSAKGYSQISLSENNAPLQKVFQKIQKQSGYDFVSNYETLKDAGNVTVNVRNVSLKNALEACLKGKRLTYVIIGKTVVVRPEEKTDNKLTAINVMEIIPPPIEIHGRVVNQQGEPLQNVSVLIVGTKIGTTTNSNGQFIITARDNKNIVLEFSSVGYETRKVKVEQQSEVNVVLESTVTGLNEVVVTALGISRQARSLGYATTTVNADEVTVNRSPNMMDALEGKIAGVNISGLGTGPAGTSKIRIRGQSSISGQNNPLIVINGIPIDNTNFGTNPNSSGSDNSIAVRGGGNTSDGGDGLNSINPDDIETMTLLK